MMGHVQRDAGEAGQRGSDLGVEYRGRDNLAVISAAFNYNRLLLQWIREVVGDHKNVIDFGAGAGAFAVPLHREGCDPLCVEQDPYFRQLLESCGLRVVSGLDGVVDESADVIYAFDVLEHIESDVEMLAVWYRKLKAGGKLLVYVPAFQLLFSGMDRKIGHYRRYRRRKLCAKLEDAGFVVEHSEYVDSLGFAAVLLYKLFGSRAGDISWTPVKLYDRCVFPVSRVCDRVLGHCIGKSVLVRGYKAAEAGRKVALYPDRSDPEIARR